MGEEAPVSSISLPLIGDEDAIMDDKGRILIGTRLRKRLGPNFAMCLGENGSLNVYREETWSKMVAQTLSLDPRMKARQDYARYLMSSAEDELDCDAQGRVVIPKKLREKANISGKVKILGCGDYIEIWDDFCYKQFLLDGRSADPTRQNGMRDAFDIMVDAIEKKKAVAQDNWNSDGQKLN